MIINLAPCSTRRRALRLLPAALIPSVMVLAAATALLGALVSCKLELNYGKYALVYGISDYAGDDSDLDYCDDDALAMEALLLDQGYSLPNIYTRVNDQANRTNLEGDFAAVATAAKEEDLFIFYYSGHGGQRAELPQGSEQAYGSDAPAEWIFLYGSLVFIPPDSYTEDLSEALSDDELAALLRTIPCARKIIIIDACNSGGFIANSVEADAVPPDFTYGSDGLLETLGDAIYLYANFQDYGSDIPPQEALVIAASGEREFSFEGYYEHGVMTYFLLESALKGDKNRDGYVTVSESYNHIYKGINNNWNNTWSGQIYGVFFPHVSGGPVDYVLFTN
jgi:hypothetical protein